MTETAAERANRRRQAWSGRVVRTGDPKGRLYESMTHAERLGAMTRLNERAWGGFPAPQPRSEWPGEVFRL